MKKLILASNNNGKIEEMKILLKDINIEVFSLKEMGIDIDVVEDGKTFEENAKKKCSEIYEELIRRKESNFMVIADDSGLEVAFLNNEPGVYSARYAGEHGNDKNNNKKLLLKLKNIPYENRRARFICQLALINEYNNYRGVTGSVEGYILKEEKGVDGFGYDPLFYYEPFRKTFSEMTMEEKNKISHRGIALEKMKKTIEELL
ncbi:XTP/dITP diphosphatase [Clostridium sp.]|uniref:XTP/dITP diphosphatase n=1 Tax=Clostridium sp. TaxID=1506 RepID=UPI002623B089|nr:XTP/dITP diphosphatase [Clostridium sp.]